MKFKFILVACLAGSSLLAFAQTHKEGIEYYKAEQHQNAKELLERNLNNPGTDKALTQYYLGRIAYDYGEMQNAAKYFQAGIAANAECPYNYIGLGAVELKKGDKKAAEAQFKLAEKFGKKDAEVAIDIARAYYEADPVLYAKEVTKYDEKARKADMQNPAIYLFEGDMKRDERNAGEAAGMYEMAANYDNQSAAAYVKYAKLFKEVNPAYGLRKLQELVSVNPSSALGQRELALAYYDLGQYDKAVNEYAKYVKNPNHFKSDENQYSFLLFYNQDFQDGYDYASKLLKENPDDFSAQRYQFMNASNIKNFPGNLLEMAEALYSKHKSNPAQYKLAQIDYNLINYELQNAGRYDEMESLLREAIAAYPEAANFKSSLASALALEEKYVDAADTINEFLASVKPNYGNLRQGALLNNYAGLSLRDENPAKAQDYLAKARNFAKQTLDLEKSVRAYKLNGDINKPETADAEVNNAVPFYEEAVAVYAANPQDSDRKAAIDSYLYLGGHYTATDADKAKEYYQKALELDPQNPGIQAILNSFK